MGIQTIKVISTTAHNYFVVGAPVKYKRLVFYFVKHKNTFRLIDPVSGYAMGVGANRAECVKIMKSIVDKEGVKKVKEARKWKSDGKNLNPHLES